MSKGRSGAVQMAAIVAVLLCAVASLECVRAATCTVGDAGGWSFNVNNWPKGKRFRAGDVLIFNNDSSLHNVVALDRKGYEKCTTPPKAKEYRSGKDKIKLVSGHNFFICNPPLATVLLA